MRRHIRLHHKIVIPLWVAAVALTAIGTYVSLSFVSNSLRSRLEGRMRQASALVAGSDFALNGAILQSLKAITGSNVVTFTRQGTVLATTLDTPTASAIVAAVTSSDAARRALESSDRIFTSAELSCGGPCYVVYRPLARRPDTVVAFATETTEIASVASALGWMILVWVGISLAALVVIGQLVARRVTTPIEHLVAFTRDVAAGQDRRATVSDGDVGRLAGAFNDMLDRLDESQASRVQSEKLALAGLMAARVAHDIRNPLASVKLQLQVLKQRLKQSQNQSALDAVLDNVVHIESVISNLIELARPGELHRREESLNAVVQAVLRQLAEPFNYRKILVDTDLADGLPSVHLDATRFRQALTNVLVNGAEAMHTGGVLCVSTRQDRGDGVVVVEVCDTGVGIDPDVAARLFEPFVSSKPNGVGLGLVNARSVVESHGGTMTLTPRDPAGTCVRIYLPVAPPSGDTGENVHG